MERSSSSLEMKSKTNKKTDEIVKESKCEHIKNILLFDTIAIQFHMRIFIEQLISHTVVILYPFLTKNHLLRLGFWSWLFNLIFPLLAYTMIVTFIFCSDNDRNLIDGGLYIPLVFFFQHRATIALKYATLSPTEYARYMECKNTQQSLQYQYQMQLFTSWMQLDEDILYFELSSASARIGSNISNVFLVISNPLLNKSFQSQFNYWNAYVRGHKVIELDNKPSKEFKLQSNGDYTLSVYDMALAIIRRANQSDLYERTNLRVRYALYFVAILNLSIPFIKLAVYDQKIDNVWLITIYYISSTIINFQFGTTVYFLLYVAIVDVLRQLNMVGQLHCMLRLTDLMMHAQLTVGAHSLTEKTIDRARARLDAIMSIQDFNARQNNRSLVNEHSLQGYTHESIDYNPLSFSTLQTAQQQMHTNGISQSVQKVDHHLNHNNTTEEVEDEEAEVEDVVDGSITTQEVQQQHDSMQNNHTLSDVLGDDKYTTRCSMIGEQIAASTNYAITPRISFHHAANPICWTYARLIIQNFGERFRFRLDAYVAMTLGLIVILILFALSAVFTDTSHNHAAFHSVYFIQSFLTVSLGTVFVIVLTYMGSLVNNELELHSRTLSIHSMKFHYKIYKETHNNDIESNRQGGTYSEKGLENIHKVHEAIEGAMDITDVNTTLKPFKILGLTAQTALTLSIITAALSFYSILASLYFGTGSTASTIISNI